MESHVRADCSFLFNLPQRRKMLIHNGTEVHINEEEYKRKFQESEHMQTNMQQSARSHSPSDSEVSLLQVCA